MPYPQQIFYMIDITCNEKCSKCNHWTHKTIKNCDIESVIQFINNIESAKELCIVGGEPLLYKKEILKLIESLGKDIRVTIITNGKNATKDFLTKIANANIHIVFSIDTINRDFWKFVRGSDSYDIVISNFNYAREILSPVKLSVQSVLSKETQSHVYEVSNMCKEYGIFHSIQYYIDDFDGKWTKQNNTQVDISVCHAYKQNLSIMPNGDIKTCFQQERINKCAKPIGRIEELPDIILNRDYTKFVREQMKKCNLPCRVLKCNQ